MVLKVTDHPDMTKNIPSSAEKIFPLPLFQEEQVVSYLQKNGHFILVNCHWETYPGTMWF